jgi:hypothetical protein
MPQYLPHLSPSSPGLTQRSSIFAKKMDGRIKSGHDAAPPGAKRRNHFAS